MVSRGGRRRAKQCIEKIQQSHPGKWDRVRPTVGQAEFLLKFGHRSIQESTLQNRFPQLQQQLFFPDL